jgi:hypothetical protein
MHEFNPANYPPAVAALLTPERLPELGPGTPNRAAQAALAALTPELIAPNPRDRQAALACLSGLWLLHNFLDESHKISQDLPTAEGSYWHGIMHRREPDASNSKYWFRQFGHHPVFDRLVFPAAVEIGYAAGKRWDPAAFIDACEAERGSGSEREMMLRKMQLAEWRLLFEWCWRQAAGE